MPLEICEFCNKEFFGRIKGQRFCNSLCQRKHYNRRPEIREKYRLRMIKYRREHHEEWKEKHRLQQRKYKDRRRSHVKEYNSRPEVRERIRQRERWFLKNDPKYAIEDRLRRSLHHALTKYSKTGKIMSSRKYGINWKEIIESLKPFPEDLKKFEIDHKIPLHTFNLNNPEEVKKAFSSDNLQWLTMEENRSKGGKIISV